MGAKLLCLANSLSIEFFAESQFLVLLFSEVSFFIQKHTHYMPDFPGVKITSLLGSDSEDSN